MKRGSFKIFLISVLFAGSCHDQPGHDKSSEIRDFDPVEYKQGTFGYDLHFLQQHDPVIVLQSDQGAAQVIVSPRYQAKVFTSTADGVAGQSFGWIHYKAFTAPGDAHMNAYGGERSACVGAGERGVVLFFSRYAPL